MHWPLQPISYTSEMLRGIELIVFYFCFTFFFSVQYLPQKFQMCEEVVRLRRNTVKEAWFVVFSILFNWELSFQQELVNHNSLSCEFYSRLLFFFYQLCQLIFIPKMPVYKDSSTSTSSPSEISIDDFPMKDSSNDSAFPVTGKWLTKFSRWCITSC